MHDCDWSVTVFVCDWSMVDRALQAEYDQLLLTHRDPSVHPDTPSIQTNDAAATAAAAVSEAEMMAEARQLTKHKTQLEVRMRILDEHNRQLEAQLQRLHMLLDHVLYHFPLYSAFLLVHT